MDYCITVYHRVDRVLGFFFSRPNWDPPPPIPSPTGECVPSFGSEGGTHSLAGEGMGESEFGRGHRHWGTLSIYICTLFQYTLVFSLGHVGKFTGIVLLSGH
jgi:hypothetical protein